MLLSLTFQQAGVLQRDTNVSHILWVFREKPFGRRTCAALKCQILIITASDRNSIVTSRDRAMWMTTDDAAQIYARFCKARYGAKATSVVRERIAQLRKRGDEEGARVWTMVAERVGRDTESKLHTAS